MDTPAPVSARDADVLAHTSHTGRYVTDEAEVIALASRGLLHDYGPQRLAGANRGGFAFQPCPRCDGSGTIHIPAAPIKN